MDKDQTAEQELNEAREYLAYWQPQLRLDHWDIEIRIAAPGELSDVWGRSITKKYQRGKVILINPVDKTDYELRRLDLQLEAVVVHELLHVLESVWMDNPKVVEAIDKDEWIARLHENSLGAIAEALVRTRRGTSRAASHA